jgi:hypothetical protein
MEEGGKMSLIKCIEIIFFYFIILSIFRIITIFCIFKCIINIKNKIANNLKEKMGGKKDGKV